MKVVWMLATQETMFARGGLQWDALRSYDDAVICRARKVDKKELP